MFATAMTAVAVRRASRASRVKTSVSRVHAFHAHHHHRPARPASSSSSSSSIPRWPEILHHSFIRSLPRSLSRVVVVVVVTAHRLPRTVRLPHVLPALAFAEKHVRLPTHRDLESSRRRVRDGSRAGRVAGHSSSRVARNGDSRAGVDGGRRDERSGATVEGGVRARGGRRGGRARRRGGDETTRARRWGRRGGGDARGGEGGWDRAGRDRREGCVVVVVGGGGTRREAGRRVVVYASLTGTSRRFATSLREKLNAASSETFELVDAKSLDDPERVLASGRDVIAIFVVSTHEGGEAPESGAWLARWAREAAYDERTGWMYLKHVRYAVYGCGNREYGDNFNRAGRELDAQLARMGGERLARRCDGDESGGRMEAQFEEWGDKLVQRLSSSQGRSVKDKDEGSMSILDAKEDSAEAEDSYESDVEGEPSIAGSEDDQDMEDIADEHGGEKKEMVTDALRGALTKQGYKILGSHSGVKLCRWTKAMLRGRGGCYKHTFYGIESHRCMETTPSLACANKCTFCWRHHTNPVGKTWRWQMDDPLELVEAAVSEHCKMVKQMKGVPGVLPEKLAEGMNPKHCALSLVGEPIMYPEIGKFVSELHSRKISTFLVTNAQFPEAITNLPPITQLYVSVDAATPETLKAIDRPLFSDYWERFVESLKSLRDKQQRTVYRLTLVSGWNMEEVAAYAKLIDLGKPDFIEIKGVTYCGSSDASSLTMKNVPYHKDVCEFGEAIVNLRRQENGEEEYGLACEHAHSCCILLARTKDYKIDNEWHTWIDYDKFQRLVASGEKFSSLDYIERTPDWATYGAEEAGFDPEQTRHRKVRNHPGKSETVAKVI